MKFVNRGKKSRIKSKGDRPRLSVCKTKSNIYAQIIDDQEGITLCSASSLKLNYGGNVEAAKKVGELIADACKSKSIEKVIFDRGNSVYQGRVAALADSARSAGLVF